MRCRFCGWENQPNSQVCERCGQPLTAHTTPSYPSYGDAGETMQPKPTVVFRGDAQPAPQPKPTAIYNPGEPPAPIPSSAPTQRFDNAPTEMHKRPASGAYPLLPETTTCQQCGAEVSTDTKFCPQCGAPIRLATIRYSPRMKFESTNKCSLTLVPEEDEHIAALTQEYTGKQITLTRDNTEPTNRTITSREQAVLTFEDDKWYVENRSELGTTYLKVNRKTELQPGDILVLGDREFRFDYQLPPEA